MKVHSRFSYFFLGIILLPSVGFAFKSYYVKSGDTLSKTAHKSFGGPVYGADGSLKRLLRLNPQISDANKIYVGDKIFLERLAVQPNTEVEVPLKNQGVQASGNTEFLTFGALEAFFGFSNLKAIDKNNSTEANFFSSHFYGLKSSWTFEMKDFSFLVGANISSYSFLESEDSSLKDKGQSTLSINVSSIWKSSKRKTSVKASLGYGEYLFLSNYNTGFILDKVQLPYLGVSLIHDFYQNSSWDLSSYVDYQHVLGGSGRFAEVENGNIAELGLKSNRKLESMSIYSQVFLNYRKQDTDIVEQTQANLGLSLGVKTSI